MTTPAQRLPLFLSLVIPLRNQAAEVEPLLRQVVSLLDGLVSDYEVVVVDNASEDDTLQRLAALTRPDGLPNLQVYALMQAAELDVAAWAGVENALGDFVVVFDPLSDDITFLPNMLEQAVQGADVVLARNTHPAPQSPAYRLTYWAFNQLYRWASGIHFAKDAPHYRLLSRSVVNRVLQHPQPALAYRHLPASSGFVRANLEYRAVPRVLRRKKLAESLDRGARLLTSTTHAPMRLVTTLSLFGALANLLYSVYVLLIAVFKTDVAPGWVSMSLQMSGMFFLISLVLLVLGEYVLNMVRMQNEGPLYQIGREFNSARITRHDKLNLEEVSPHAARPAHD